jgi:hypothetical protein
MTWTKLGDEFSDDTCDLTDAERITHVDALVWSNKRGLDFLIPKRHLRYFAKSPLADEATEGLVAAGLWEDRGDSWYVGVYHPEWQLESTVVKERQQNNALRQQRFRRHKVGDHSICLPGGPCPDAPGPSVTRYETDDVTRYKTRDPGRVGSGPTAPAAPQGQPPGQTPGQGQGQPIANSQNRRVHDGPGPLAGDAHQIRDNHTESAATDRNARAREPARCELAGCLTPNVQLGSGRRYHIGCEALIRRSRGEAVIPVSVPDESPYPDDESAVLPDDWGEVPA